MSKLSFSLLSCWLSCCMAEIYVSPSESQYNFIEYEDMPAMFGPRLSDRVFRGILHSAEIEDVCTKIKPPPSDFDVEIARWAVLVPRYNDMSNCSFAQKVLVAQEAGYEAVIVHNVNSNQLIAMSAQNATGIYIPSVFVGENVGMDLIRKTGSKYFIVITGSSFNFQTHLLIPFAIVVGICFAAMIIFMVVKCIKDCRRRRRYRLPTSALNKIPTYKYQKGCPYETCAICLDDYLEGEKLRILPCNHVYHTKCIDPWLTKSKRVCPICKRKVFARNEQPHDSDTDTEDPDDTTPLITSSGGGANRSRGGGTFHTRPSPERQQELIEGMIQRALGHVAQPHTRSRPSPPPSLNQQQHSINGDLPTTTTTNSSSDEQLSSMDTSPTPSTTPSSCCDNNSNLEVHIHVHNPDVDSCCITTEPEQQHSNDHSGGAL